ncbi:MAG: SDR family oxidoreductase [Acidimicrobiia bacterium]|nr:SDR family oxidoreductase [Acidimicrobiia bacterium]
MAGRLDGRVAVICGAGQTPGETIGNGRATALVFAREGAQLLLVDRRPGAADETAELVRAEGGTCETFDADITDEVACRALVAAAVERFGRVDVLHNNVGIGFGDGGPTSLTEENWHRIMDVNLTGAWLVAKAALGPMREQQSGVITNISSVAAIAATPMLAYKVSKAGMNALTQSLASANARFGIRANAIMPGLMDTPMAIEGYSEAQGVSREEVRERRARQVPLQRRAGTGWDTANASLFLASDEARYITGVLLPVDGGVHLKVG